jgi:hypothetical protein
MSKEPDISALTLKCKRVLDLKRAHNRRWAIRKVEVSWEIKPIQLSP